MNCLQEHPHLVELVQSDYREMPGLSLSKAQLQRLWGIDADTCDAVVETLEAEGFLRRTAHDLYVRFDAQA
jgi:DNA-binding IclR family transcriptional regulator